MEIVLLAVEGFNQRPGCFDQENRVSALSPWRLCLDHGALGNYAERVLSRIGNEKRPLRKGVSRAVSCCQDPNSRPTLLELCLQVKLGRMMVGPPPLSSIVGGAPMYRGVPTLALRPLALKCSRQPV